MVRGDGDQGQALMQKNRQPPIPTLRFGRLLQHRIFIAIAAVAVAFSAAIYVVSVPLIKDKGYEIELGASRTILDAVFVMASEISGNLTDQRSRTIDASEGMLRTVVDVAASYADALHGRLARGELTESEARRLLYDGLRAFKYGNNDYVWATDYHSVLQSHPSPEFQGMNAALLRDPSGELILPAIIAVARSKGEGVHNYHWQRLGAHTLSEKMSYFRDLPRWGLVIGTGVYLDDIDAEVAKHKAEAIAQLRDALNRIRIARTGYVYIFDGHNTMLIHPNGNIEGSAFGALQDPATGKSIAEELKAVADSDHPLTYLWDRPDDPGNYTYEKISWVRHFKDFDWYIASSVYGDELKRSSSLLSMRLLWTALALLGVACGLGYIWATRLVRPINRLAETAALVRGGNLTATSGVMGDDEIGVLAAAFDDMVAEVRNNIVTLDARVAERTRALEDAQDSVVEAQRMKAVGQLAGGLAHDFNNLLSVILGNLALARDRFGALSGLDAFIEPALRASRRGADITSRLLAFSRQHPMAPQSVEAMGLLSEMAALLRPSLPQTIHLALPELGQPCWVMADPGQLQNALINLALNAKDAMPEGGRLAFTVGPPDSLEGFDEPVLSGDYIGITVSDTGTGLAQEVLPHAFEPFFTTKEAGSGLGLSMVYGFVKQSGGYIRLLSPMGEGASVTLLLPKGAVGENKSEKSDDAVPLWPGRLVLLVEDNADVRVLLRQQLTDMGLAVIEAENGEEALRLVADVRELTAVISDIAMPGLSGLEMTRTLRQSHPHLPVILISGFASDGSGDLADVVILSKPWERRDLANALSAIMGEPDGKKR